jgi:hypothetical protein
MNALTLFIGLFDAQGRAEEITAYAVCALRGE